MSANRRSNALPDWQLPPGVDRGLWDYLHSSEMIDGYDIQMASSPLARTDSRLCESVFATPGRLLDLGCGTGRLCIHFAAKGYDCVGVDLSDAMLAKASGNAAALNVRVEWLNANVVQLAELPNESFDYVACLFSTLGMVCGIENRRSVLANAARLLKPHGRLVLHVHNRWFRGLGLKRVAAQFMNSILARPGAGDIAMPQAYGGAPLTLHHFTRREIAQMLKEAGFRVEKVIPLGLTENGELKLAGWLGLVRAYGFLISAERKSLNSVSRPF